MAARQKGPSKLCMKCNRVLPLGDFYPNREWMAQNYRDAWCKDCVAKFCEDEESLRKYCSYNNRRFSTECWEKARIKAESAVSNIQEYILPKTNAEKREKIFLKTQCKQYFGLMNLKPFYRFIDNLDEQGIYIGDEIPQKAIEEDPDSKPVYSDEWRGTYTPREIKLLDEQYKKLEDDFDLTDESRRDYARKIVRASLNADKAEDKYRSGEISLKEYSDAINIFDTLSKSNLFAACRKKEGEAANLSVLGLIVQQVETQGYLDHEDTNFPPDQIDAIIADLNHTLVAAGIRGEL